MAGEKVVVCTMAYVRVLYYMCVCMCDPERFLQTFPVIAGTYLHYYVA